MTTMPRVPVPHGTPCGYSYHKCRCDACKTAVADYARAWKKAHPRPPRPPHILQRDKQCSVDGCEQPAFCRDWCRTHYNRWKHTGQTELTGKRRTNYTSRPLADRFWEKVDKTPTCWLWTGGGTTLGYGTIWLGAPKRRGMAHRVAYELLVGPIPDGLQLDHLCRNPSCVNPAHLEPVTPAENSRRGIAGKLAVERAKAITQCPQGHAYTPDNLLPSKLNRRACRICNRERVRARQAAKRNGVPYADPFRDLHSPVRSRPG